MNTTTVQYQIHIRPRRSFWEVDWQGLCHYSDLLWLLVRRDFVSKYKQTILGPAWMLIQPLATTVVFTLVFAKMANISTNSSPPALFYMSGLLAWNLFAQILGGSGNVLQNNAHLFGKVYFPRIIVPLANGISAVIPFAIQLVLFFVIYAFLGATQPTHHAGSWFQVLAFPVFALQAVLVGLGGALIFSSLTAVYRDLQHLLAFIVQIWMYLTPVIVPLSQFSERWPKWMWLVQLNPMTVPVEGMRWSLLGAGSLTPTSLAVSWSMALAIFFAGFLWFNKIERSYVDQA
ncbi:MAG: ABC transporter permease [Terrimicrobiaceae bacterium]|nr:ABC transporter permease [Terrimicrobiaceae bacterium]